MIMKNSHLVLTLVAAVGLSSCGFTRPFYLRSWERSRLSAQKARFQHHYESAERSAKEAISQAEFLGSDDFRLAVSLYDLAGIYVLRDKYKLAFPLLARALQVLQSAKAKNNSPELDEIVSQEQARTLLALGDLNYRRKKFAEALSEYQQSSEILQRWCNPEKLEAGNPLGMEFVRAVWGQAECQYALEKFSLADKLFYEALSLAEANSYSFDKELGERYSHFLKSQGRVNLAEDSGASWRELSVQGREAYKDGNYAKARDLFLRALVVARQFRPDDIRLVASHKNIADACIQTKELGLAESHYESALMICRSMTQPLFALRDDLLQCLASIKMVSGKYEEADRYGREDLALREKYFGESEKTAEILSEMAYLEGLRHNMEEAHRLAIRSYEMLLKDHGRRRRTAMLFSELGDKFTDCHDYSRALSSYKFCLEIWKNRLALAGDRIVIVMSKLAYVCLLNSDLAEASRYFQMLETELLEGGSGAFIASASTFNGLLAHADKAVTKSQKAAVSAWLSDLKNLASVKFAHDKSLLNKLSDYSAAAAKLKEM